MIPFWEMYSAYENATEPLPDASESSNPKSEFQSDTKRHNLTCIRRLSPIIGISILGVASSCFGYYTAQNQSRIAHNEFLVAQNNNNTVWPIPGIGKVRLYRINSNTEKCVRNNDKKPDCYPIPDNVLLYVDPRTEKIGNYYRFRVRGCTGDGCNNSDVQDKFVDSTFLVCQQNCAVSINYEPLQNLVYARTSANNLVSKWSVPVSPITRLQERNPEGW